MKMKWDTFLFLCIAILCPVLGFAQTPGINLPAGSAVPVKFSAKVTSDDNQQPQAVVAQNITDAGGNVLVASGAPVETRTAKTPSTPGKGSNITVTFIAVAAVDGQKINLSGTCSVSGKKGTNLVQVNGQGIKGKPAEISEATPVENITVAGNYEVKLRHEAASLPAKKEEPGDAAAKNTGAANVLKKQTDIQLDGLFGSIRQIKQECKEQVAVGEDDLMAPCDNYQPGTTYNSSGFKTEDKTGPTEKITYKYDNNNNLVEKNGLVYKERYTYDAKGNKTELNTYELSGRHVGKTTYTYNEKNNLAEEIHSNLKAITTRQVNKYDDKNRKTETQHYTNGNMSGKTVYKYNEAGNLAEEGTYNSKQALYARHTFKYNDKGKRTEEISYSFPQGTISTRGTYTYDDKGNITEACQYNGAKLIEKYTYVYAYDKAGNWVTKSDYLNAVLQCVVKREITYFE